MQQQQQVPIQQEEQKPAQQPTSPSDNAAQDGAGGGQPAEPGKADVAMDGDEEFWAVQLSSFFIYYVVLLYINETYRKLITKSWGPTELQYSRST